MKFCEKNVLCEKGDEITRFDGTNMMLWCKRRLHFVQQDQKKKFKSSRAAREFMPTVQCLFFREETLSSVRVLWRETVGWGPGWP